MWCKLCQYNFSIFQFAAIERPNHPPCIEHLFPYYSIHRPMTPRESWPDPPSLLHWWQRRVRQRRGGKERLARGKGGRTAWRVRYGEGKSRRANMPLRTCELQCKCSNPRRGWLDKACSLNFPCTSGRAQKMLNALKCSPLCLHEQT